MKKKWIALLSGSIIMSLIATSAFAVGIGPGNNGNAGQLPIYPQNSKQPQKPPKIQQPQQRQQPQQGQQQGQQRPQQGQQQGQQRPQQQGMQQQGMQQQGVQPLAMQDMALEDMQLTDQLQPDMLTADQTLLDLQVPIEPVVTQLPTTNNNQYTLEQAMSDNAQLSTIAFSGLAFITGSSGADTFMPPGKVADFFGFQYMRDVDTAGYGHNTTFLSRVANNVLYVLNDAQKAKLIALAKEQAPLYSKIAYNRFPLMNAFRRNLEGNIPSGATGLSLDAVSQYTGQLYKTDADLSYNRAVVVGGIINSFTDEQKAYLAKMSFNNYATWPAVAENETLKKNLTNNEFVAVMTYASELFSWYKGSLDADVYFCPERHGTYFGGFYMKDYPAMNNPSYFISTAITGDSGKEFLNTLNDEQRALITGIIEEQRSALTEIAQIRTEVSTELRNAMTGGTVDKAKVYALIQRYGELDGQMSGLYAQRFAEVNKTLTAAQRATLVKLRNLDVVPKGAYSFSTPISMPAIPNTDFLFGVGTMSSTAGQLSAPASFSAATNLQTSAQNKQPALGQSNQNGQKQPAQKQPNQKNQQGNQQQGNQQQGNQQSGQENLKTNLSKLVANKTLTQSQLTKVLAYFEKYKPQQPGVPAPKGSDPLSMLVKDKIINDKQAQAIHQLLPPPQAGGNQGQGNQSQGDENMGNDLTAPGVENLLQP